MHSWRLHGHYLVSIAPLVLPCKNIPCFSWVTFAPCDRLDLERKDQYPQLKLGWSNVVICQLSRYEESLSK